MALDVLHNIEKNDLLQDGDRLLVAVSGGPDSMALLYWLNQYRSKWNLDIMAVHLNHSFRGVEADKDQIYVQETCRKWGIAFVSEKIDVATYAEQHKKSKQVAARECRYEWFEKIAQEYQFNKIAMAHHADDQIETVLMRMIRGTGLSGLGGIPVVRETHHLCIIRPFMNVTKQEIEKYCKEHDIQPRIDQSNLSEDYTRNYIRHQIVPQMRTLNPNLHQVLSSMTETVRNEHEFLDQLAQGYIEQVVVSRTKNMITLNVNQLNEIPLALQRRLILIILSYLPIDDSSWNKIHINHILDLVKTDEGFKRIDLPNQFMAIKEYTYLYFSHEKVYKETERRSVYQDKLPAEGEYRRENPFLSILISRYARSLSHIDGSQPSDSTRGDPYVGTFDAEQLVFPLVVRNRISGDKMQPMGMEGHKKVKNIFIDAKIPVVERHDWPIISDQEGILWIPGLKKSNRGKVTQDTKKLITIKVRKG